MSNADWKLDGPIIVRKYGGSSLADIPRLREVARDLRAARAAGQHLVVVVSAMGDQTDQLVHLAHAANPQPPRRELDMLLTVGERISMSLLSMALAAEGVPALSLTGSQVGIITDASHTDARIREVKAFRIREALAAGKIVVVAGFQGYSAETREITTLGRGGSDTTAVALAHALGAERCEILKDVAGVMTADPKLVPSARCLESLTYEEMQAIAAAGCGVVHPRAVAYAARHGVKLYVASSFVAEPGTTIGAAPGDRPLPAATLHALAITTATGQARLHLRWPDAAPPAEVLQLILRATAAGPLTAEWFASGERWHWEGWGRSDRLADSAAAACVLASRDQRLQVLWQPEQAVLTLAVSRPECWPAALHSLRSLLAQHSQAVPRLRTDGETVRLLVPQAEAAYLARIVHDRLVVA